MIQLANDPTRAATATALARTTASRGMSVRSGGRSGHAGRSSAGLPPARAPDNQKPTANDSGS